VEVPLEKRRNGDLKAGIDLGRERLIAAVTEPVNEVMGAPLRSTAEDP
jgi:hypothetical protein